MKRPWLGVILLALGSSVFNTGAYAGTVNDVGSTVRSALEIQRSGDQSAPARPMLKDVADRTYERYLESFTYPIPEQFERDASFSADGNG